MVAINLKVFYFKNNQVSVVVIEETFDIASFYLSLFNELTSTYSSLTIVLV